MSDNPYLDFGLSAATEIPATFIAARLMDSPYLGRRSFIVGAQLTLCAALATAYAAPHYAIAASLLGKFAATGSFNLIYVQATELFPTQLRTTALGLCSCAARVGSLFAPLLGRALGSTATMWLIATICLLAATLSWTVVPETVGRGMGDADAPAEPAGATSGTRGRRPARTQHVQLCEGVASSEMSGTDDAAVERV